MKVSSVCFTLEKAQLFCVRCQLGKTLDKFCQSLTARCDIGQKVFELFYLYALSLIQSPLRSHRLSPSKPEQQTLSDRASIGFNHKKMCYQIGYLPPAEKFKMGVGGSSLRSLVCMSMKDEKLLKKKNCRRIENFRSR